MKTVTINRLDKYVDKEIEIKGWVYNRRSVGKIWFLILRDGTGLLQCVVVDGECDKDTFNLLLVASKAAFKASAVVCEKAATELPPESRSTLFNTSLLVYLCKSAIRMTPYNPPPPL